jgi:glycerophosphoryl diester phosphodiesterase
MLILAHRGAHGPETVGVRENTLEAFGRAAETADGVELDVRLSQNGDLWVHHDRELDGRPIAELTARPAWLPTLDEALDACAGMAMVNVELKADTAADLATPVSNALHARPNVFVSSFNLVCLDAFHAIAPDIPTGWLTMSGYDQDDALETAAAAGHAALNPPDNKTTRALVERTHAAGLEIVVWTVNDAARMEELARWGVDVLVTDFPGLAAQTLR